MNFNIEETIMGRDEEVLRIEAQQLFMAGLSFW